jgi:hypothetical protein
MLLHMLRSIVRRSRTRAWGEDCEINTTYELMGIFRSRPRREASRAIAITERAAGPRSVSLRTSTLGQLEPLIWN